MTVPCIQWGLVIHMHITVQSYDLNQCWLTSKGTHRKKLVWYLDQNIETMFQSYAIKMLLAISGLICSDLNMLTHWGRDKMDANSQTTFSSAFSWMKIFEFRLKFHWSLFLRVQLTYSSIGSDNGLAPSRGQAIIWTNDGLFTDAYMHHSASMS